MVNEREEDTIRYTDYLTNLDENASWNQEGVQIAGGDGWGNDARSLQFPTGIYVDEETDSVFIADCYNHRIIEWKKGAEQGETVIAVRRNNGKLDFLSRPLDFIYDKSTDSFIISEEVSRRVTRWPRSEDKQIEILVSDIDPWGIALDKYGYLYVCDHKKHEVKRWKIGESTGTVVAGGNNKGCHMNQLKRPTFIRVDDDQSVYVSDRGNSRIIKWPKGASQGIIVAGGQDQHKVFLHLYDPFGFVLDRSGNIYVVDWTQNRVLRYTKGVLEPKKIAGGGGLGKGADQFHYPMSLALDREGNLYVTDYCNHRVQKFSINHT